MGEMGERRYPARYPTEPPTGSPAGAVFDARFHLLDRQVVDPDGHPVCKVDDLELELGEDGHPYVTAILAGPGALGPRIGGWPGRFMVAVHRRLHPAEDPQPARVPWTTVAEIGNAIQIAVRVDQTDTQRLEHWAYQHVVARIPEAFHAPE